MAEAVKLPAPLPPEALDFIQKGTPKPITPLPALAPAAETLTANVAAVKPAETKTESRLPSAKARGEPHSENGSVQISLRLSPSMQRALFKAATDRKLKQLEPCTQREILIEALTAWLNKNGYLN